ncbi:beta-1,3-galactosyltransferase 5 [Bombina bombina]|uniref:beta-1,3-galactosyltransferase 5 n=1 Tax=Bombina bombina TaxID=8345 RepID=UPI00235B22FB|nr:beta-1,3-galactosyltransferase 5 [Bombina bombina]XP_053561891.1 beta-1,3-galactosyltransferase 5 [Bombina bombina]XP_053561892.1 beta-1,3-galactosyltransferase 5 [Bombina bombina]
MKYQMARRHLIFTIVFLFSCFGIFAIMFELRLMDFHPFCYKKEEFEYFFDSGTVNSTFLMLPKIDCKTEPPYLVILITTTPNQQKARMAIRDTWGKERWIGDKRVVAYFLLGTTQIGRKEEYSLAVERHMYKDFIQKDFIDVYSNLTYKTLMGLEWINHYCPETSFVMKTDTDMFVNPVYLVQKLLEKNQTTNLFTGFLKLNEFPIRIKSSKWYTSIEEYPKDRYPPFCSGTGYVFSVDVAQKIYQISGIVPFFKLEDVYIGLCLEKIEIRLQEFHNQQLFYPEKPPFSVCSYRNIVTSHGFLPHEIQMYWEAMERADDEEC